MKKIFILLFLLISISAQPQRDTIKQDPEKHLLVGVYPKPPYIIKENNDTWDGLSIRLWRAVADKMDVTYKFVEIPEGAEPANVLVNNTDIVLLRDVTSTDSIIDFSHIYYIDQMGAATSKKMKLSTIANAFFNKKFWYIAGSLSVLLLIIGTIIYFLERKQNEDNFGGERSVARGIGAGFWWAGVTMTTIGYGDKAPVTFFGRAVALLWMLIAMAVTAVLTASIVSAVVGNTQKQISIPDDLRSMKVAIVEDASAVDYMKQERIQYKAFKNLPEALEAVNKEDVDVLVHNVPAMRYEINNDSDLALKVKPISLVPNYYAFAITPENPLKNEINEALLEVIKNPIWQQELNRFIPDK